MIEYKNIFGAYVEADSILSHRENRARNKAPWNRKRQLNDQAYFIMLFAQLEDKINRICVSLITNKKKLRNWGTRRSWDIIDLDNFENRFYFMKRVALLVEKGNTEYNKIEEYYKIRCKIAHGNVAAVSSINIPREATAIKNISLRLRE